MTEQRPPRSADDERSRPSRRVRQGCPASEARERLVRAGLRPTAQRCAVAWLLAGPTHRHVTPESLFHEVTKARVSVSLSSIYNIVRRFTEAGLLRQRSFKGLTIYDTDVSDHQHFLIEETQEVINMPGTPMQVGGLPSAPEGYEIAGIELIARVRSKR